MRVIGPRLRAPAQIVERPGGPYPSRGAVARQALTGLARLARLHWIFAIAEISKGLAIVAIGDMVIAEDLGEVVKIAAVGLPEMRRRAMHGRPAGLARASGAVRGRVRLRMAIRRLSRNSELCS
jgi:hypothetical protein